MRFQPPPGFDDPLRRPIQRLYRAPEERVVRELLDAIDITPSLQHRIDERARDLVEAIRAERRGHGGLDAFLHEFDLSSQEGVVLMCLAEALLRVPDAPTADRLIEDKLSSADWASHLGHSESLFVNASTWALMLTGRFVTLDDEIRNDWQGFLRRLAVRSGEPVIRTAVTRAMRIMGSQFVLAENIDDALRAARDRERDGFRYSYDMLGEAARTMADADHYHDSYRRAIESIGRVSAGRGPVTGPGISVKLSALHPRYEYAKTARVMGELAPRVAALARQAAEHGIGMTVDAEEADRLEPSLAVFEALASDPSLAGWNGLGLAVQAYQKRATAVLDWLVDLARRSERRIMVRLVKGAYWDTEIKRTQELGLDDYPVFTRKVCTDVSYLACVQRMLAAGDAIYPQFATHNAQTVAAVMTLAGDAEFEFQCLHGMGEALYERVVHGENYGRPCRIYAPVGVYRDLLAYLVRRLLENGANTSFVNRLVDEKLPVAEIVADPVTRLRALTRVRHPRIPLPIDLYGDSRRNSRGVDLTDSAALEALRDGIGAARRRTWRAVPQLAAGESASDDLRSVTNPANRRDQVGTVIHAGEADIDRALAAAEGCAWSWDHTPAGERAAILERAADLYEAHRDELMALCLYEAGKTLNDGVAEVREAADFLRYYAMQARRDFAAPAVLPGPTGERNEISLHGRGPFVCISPWNFPLAIFTGQVSAALAAGNPVLAKPAEQTPLIAARGVELLHEAGVPRAALQLLPGDGGTVGARLVEDPRIAGVAFTGSVETAHRIARALAQRDGPIVPLIAETGGQNAMIVDSTALPEQVVRDVVISAFQSAGQRCSASRILCLQSEIAAPVLEMLEGAMAELLTGDPADLATDIGPVIDEGARRVLEEHVGRFGPKARRILRAPEAVGSTAGVFFPPVALEIDSVSRLEGEVFGPVLHVVRFPSSGLERLVDEINATRYGLTLGVHSRIDATLRRVRERARVGNLYANRSMIGAVVGVQPFGGEGLSGTGPKAGGPRYLYRFATERSLSVDTTAAGGNASLLALDEG